MVVRDARVDHSDADTLTRDPQLLTRERGSRRQSGALHRCKDGTVQVHALNARIRRNLRELGVIHFSNLPAAAKSSSRCGSFSQQSHVAVALELDDDASAAGQLPCAVPQKLIQLVASVAAAT